MWQTLILTCWNPLFADIPVESLVHEHQQEYYDAIAASTRKGDSSPFIEFMLRMIHDILSFRTPQVIRLLAAFTGEMSREMLQSILGLRDRKSFRERYLIPALLGGLIEMTITDKPNSRLQKYRLTGKGQVLINAENN